jgi:nucleoside 2-deoxyribosyltransferase
VINLYRYEKSLEDVRLAPKPSVFLAGPTVRGNQTHLTSWCFKAIEEFEKQRFIGSLIIPEFTSKTESDKGKDWIVEWENNGLSIASCIMFWIPRTRELIGLTTNFELGYWLAKDWKRVVYGRPDDAFRVRYLDLMWDLCPNWSNEPSDRIYSTLEETVKASIDKIGNISCKNN